MCYLVFGCGIFFLIAISYVTTILTKRVSSVEERLKNIERTVENRKFCNHDDIYGKLNDLKNDTTKNAKNIGNINGKLVYDNVKNASDGLN